MTTQDGASPARKWAGCLSVEEKTALTQDPVQDRHRWGGMSGVTGRLLRICRCRVLQWAGLGEPVSYGCETSREVGTSRTRRNLSETVKRPTIVMSSLLSLKQLACILSLVIGVD